MLSFNKLSLDSLIFMEENYPLSYFVKWRSKEDIFSFRGKPQDSHMQ